MKNSIVLSPVYALLHDIRKGGKGKLFYAKAGDKIKVIDTSETVLIVESVKTKERFPCSPKDVFEDL